MRAALALQQEATARGFLWAWSPLDLPTQAAQAYQQWLQQGYQAQMHYLGQHLAEKLTPSKRFDWAQSVLLLAVSHGYPAPAAPTDGLRVGRVARYAWVRDYHRLIKPHLEALEQLAQRLGVQAKGYVDHGPFSERSYGVLSGLGWIGKNTMLMRMGEGSYLTLAVLLTSVPLNSQPAAYPNRCGRCTRCLAQCPTQALLPGGVLDSRRCISYWTIEHRGLIPEDLWRGIGDWLLGCDVCQEVCPWNHKVAQAWAGFEPQPELVHPNLEDFFTLSGYGFARKYHNSVFLRPGRTRMARNALVVLSNLKHPSLPVLAQMALKDSNPVVHQTALTALRLWENDRF